MIGNKPSSYRSQLCHYCGAANDSDVCSTCDLGNLFSDCWKDQYGVRPKFWAPARTKRAFLEARRRAS